MTNGNRMAPVGRNLSTALGVALLASLIVLIVLIVAYEVEIALPKG